MNKATSFLAALFTTFVILALSTWLWPNEPDTGVAGIKWLIIFYILWKLYHNKEKDLEQKVTGEPGPVRLTEMDKEYYKKKAAVEKRIFQTRSQDDQLINDLKGPGKTNDHEEHE